MKIKVSDNMATTPTSRGVVADAQGGLSPALARAKKRFAHDIFYIQFQNYYINEKKQLQTLCYMLFKSGWYIDNKSIITIIEGGK